MNQEERDELLIELKVRVTNIEALMEKFVTRDVFAPVKAIAFGLMALISVAVVGAVLKLVVLK